MVSIHKRKGIGNYLRRLILLKVKVLFFILCYQGAGAILSVYIDLSVRIEPKLENGTSE